jgi:hypothetical protein
MSRAPQTFRQSDVTRALKATVKAGIAVRRIEIEKTGKIVVVAATPQEADRENPEQNEWDVVLKP